MTSRDAPKETAPSIKPRPAPIVDPEWEPYWAGTRAGSLMIQRCTICGRHQLYARAHCLACRGPVEWTASGGAGVVYSFTVIRQNPSRAFRHLIPYVVALVDLDEGPRLMTNIVGSPVEDVTIGSRVRVRFEPVSDDASLPLFELDAVVR